MSYAEYWDGASDMAKYYRDMDERLRERRNEELWLQGFYVYEAILNATPVLNPMSKKHKPIPYRKEPIPITEARHRQQEEEDKQRRINAGFEAMRQIMTGVNRKFKEKGG